MADLQRVKRLVPSAARPLARRAYWLLRGRYPEPVARLALHLKARHPVTFSDKVLYRMAHDRRPVLTLFSDKVGVREYVEQRVGEWILPRVHGVHESAREMLDAGLPASFVMKPSHGSSAAVICWEGNDPGARIDKDLDRIGWERFLVHPANLDPTLLGALADKWLRLDYSYVMGPDLPEWGYRNVPHRILLEEVLLDADGDLPQDYKFFMFDGTCRLAQVDSRRFTHHTLDLFTPEWDLLDVGCMYPRSATPPPPPQHLHQMLEIAEALSKGMDFVRVDLYETREGIRFGELTSYPGGGAGGYEPASFEYELGRYWQLAV
jgi:TupA-like ATPgrasp